MSGNHSDIQSEVRFNSLNPRKGEDGTKGYDVLPASFLSTPEYWSYSDSGFSDVRDQSLQAYNRLPAIGP